MKHHPVIVWSAIKMNGVVWLGKRHGAIIQDIVRELGSGSYKGYDANGKSNQGFIDFEGNFYSREEAKAVVEVNGQPYKPISSTLTSEDLW